MSDEFIVASLSAVAPLLLPLLKVFRIQHPAILLRYLISGTLFRLEYGEAHVAVRTRPKPSDLRT